MHDVLTVPAPTLSPTKPAFALIDCNNFFVSCERVFRPDLQETPVIVLSSNDGCAVARSNEVKDLGIPMGAPAFKYRQILRDNKVKQFSANFELYGDISQRITQILTGITPRTEVYSVDESFLDLSQLAISDYTAWAVAIKQRIWREVGVPVSVGLAPTKTLAKLGAERAKKVANGRGSAFGGGSGVVDFISMPLAERTRQLKETPVQDIWGVGRQLAPKLRAEGVFNALELSQLRPLHAKQLMGIHGRQMVAELNGTCCHPLEQVGKVRQSVMHGRMFGQDTNDFGIVEAAIASLTARAAFRLRRENLLARRIILILDTNRHLPGYQRRSAEIRLDTPSADTGNLTALLVEKFQGLYSPGVMYHRANVLLYDLVDGRAVQADLFGHVNLTQHDGAQARMLALDSINDRYGKGSIRFAAEDLSKKWEPKHELRSPRYTTQWDELPVASIQPRQ